MIMSRPNCNLHNEKYLKFHYRVFACHHRGIEHHGGWKRNFSQNLFLLKASYNRYPRSYIQITTLTPMQANHSGIPAVEIAFIAFNQDVKLIL